MEGMPKDIRNHSIVENSTTPPPLKPSIQPFFYPSLKKNTNGD